MWYSSLMRTLLISIALLLPSLGLTTGNEPSNGSGASPNEAENPRNHVPKASVASLNETENPRNRLSNGSTASPNETESPRHELFNESVASTTVADIPRFELPDVTLSTGTENPRNKLSERTVSTPTKTDSPGNELCNGSKASSIDTLNPKIDSFRITSPFSDRRQYPGQNQQFRPPSDFEISRILNKYREFVKKNPKGKLQEVNSDQSVEYDVAPRVNDTQPFYMGQRGPIRHNPTREPNKPGIKRQGREKVTGVTASGTPPPVVNWGDVGFASTMATQEYAGPTNMGAGRKTPPTQRPSKGGKNKDKEGKDDQAGDGKDGTAQNDAQGHARFTTKRTTTSRRRRTSPNRISLAEDCDYLAYYCLKAYDMDYKTHGRMFHS